MVLTQGQKAIVTRAKSLGSGGQAVALSDEACAYLVAVIVRDLGLEARFPEIPATLPEVFSPGPLSGLELAGIPFLEVFERLVGLDANTDVYFMCLAALHKARLKYERILETQVVPTIDQVGPRGLLQYGGMNPRMLAGFLLWRKWVFDIDNRAGQETGYLFEPIIAAAVGGVSASAKKSPVKRRKDRNKGRQVDCLRENLAYEIKIRMTIAASGQGRWGEELEFPEDCRQSGYVPVLIVLDPTPSRSWMDCERRSSAQVGRSTSVKTRGRTSENRRDLRWRDSWRSTFTIHSRHYSPRSRPGFRICYWRWVQSA